MLKVHGFGGSSIGIGFTGAKLRYPGPEKNLGGAILKVFAG
jgi:hypothetical protein